MPDHILHIAPTPFFADRGCHIRIEGIVHCLSALGFGNTVCTYHHGRDVRDVQTIRISPIKNYTQTAAGPSKYKLWADWKLLWLSLAEYKRIKPIALHAHLHEGLLIALIIKTLMFWRGTPVIADMQGSLTGELDSHGAFKKLPFLRWPTRTLERFLMWMADYIVCSSAHALAKIQSEFNVPNDKISLAQDGANTAPSLAAAELEKLKQELQLPQDKLIVVYSGALLEAKGLNELKALIKHCDNPDLKVHFLVIGYPVEDLRAYLEQNHLSQNCTLTGQVDFERLPEFLSMADIAIDPKNSEAGEGSGKMLNYLACALPVVAFDTQNNREFLPPGTQLANDQAELLAQLTELLNKQAARDLAAKANLGHFEQGYSWNVTQAQLSAAYSKLSNS